MRSLLVGKTETEATQARPSALPPTEAELAAETQVFTRSPKVDAYMVEHPASDYMIDVLTQPRG